MRLASQDVTQRRILPKCERNELPKTKYRNDNLLKRYRAFFYPRISNAKRVASPGAITTSSALRRANPAIKKPCTIHARIPSVYRVVQIVWQGSVLNWTFFMIYDIFVNCNWVVTRWQKYSTHLYTNNTENDTKQTIHRTTQQFWKSAGRAPFWLVIPWHLLYNRGKNTDKPQSG